MQDGYLFNLHAFLPFISVIGLAYLSVGSLFLKNIRSYGCPQPEPPSPHFFKGMNSILPFSWSMSDDKRPQGITPYPTALIIVCPHHRDLTNAMSNHGCLEMVFKSQYRLTAPCSA
jgi:hypothetical protein